MSIEQIHIYPCIRKRNANHDVFIIYNQAGPKDCCFIRESEGNAPSKRRKPLRHVPVNMNP